MPSPRILTALFPDLLWYRDQFVAGLAVLISDLGILEIKDVKSMEDELARRRGLGEYITIRRLPRRAVLPGFVNTHSHAFQRAIRGRTEFPADVGSGEENFWSWREIMYQAALRLSPVDVEAISQAVFVEMVKSGITRVGEFHYLHHQSDGTLYPEPDELALRVLSGATSAGLRVTLLRSFYERAGVGRPHPEGAQKIFCDPNVDYYLATLDRLQDAGHSVGVTAHSVRAVTRQGLVKLLEYSRHKGLPFHIHVSEQCKEIEECVQEYGMRPIQLLSELGALGPSTTLVHAIHLTPDEIQAVGRSACHIASCPTTERNLGDGIVPAKALLEAGAIFTFGTDSQCQICLPEDARQLEYHLRLREEKRSLLFAGREEAGPRFLKMLTSNGARSLGDPDGGRVECGAPSDLIAIDLEHLSLAGATAESLALDIVFSSSAGVVSDVWVAATEIVSQGVHRAEHQARRNLERVMKSIRGEMTCIEKLP
jgi:formimidoylglutamate deiminase